MEIQYAAFISSILCSSIICSPIWPVLEEYHEEESLVSELNFEGQSRNDFVLQFSTFGQKYFLILESSNEIFARDLKISSSNSTIVDFDQNSLRGQFFTEKDGQGSFYVEIVDGHIQLDGIVDKLLRIRHKDGHHKAIRVSLDKYKNAFAHDTVTHPSYFRKINPKSTVIDQPEMPEVPDEVTVEIFAVVDFELQKSLQMMKMPIAKYLGILWNHVQTEYKSMSEPRITFSITEFTLLPEADWIKSTIVEHVPFGVATVNSHSLLDKFGDWLSSKLNDVDRPRYDIAIMHTGLDLASPIPGKQSYSSANLGVAYVNGVCNFDDYGVMSSGLMEDLSPSKFDGIITVTHEVAHLFGATHDNELPEDLHCPEHYIMYYAVGDNTINKFSHCSVNSMRAVLSLPESSCVWKKTSSTAIPMGEPDK